MSSLRKRTRNLGCARPESCSPASDPAEESRGCETALNKGSRQRSRDVREPGRQNQAAPIVIKLESGEEEEEEEEDRPEPARGAAFVPVEVVRSVEEHPRPQTATRGIPAFGSASRLLARGSQAFGRQSLRSPEGAEAGPEARGGARESERPASNNRLERQLFGQQGPPADPCEPDSEV